MFGIFRFILAINVVLFHLLGVKNIGPLAVYSFFILSGFLMTTIMQQTYSYSLNGFKKYILNRFLRLYPLYWVLLAITMLSLLLIGDQFSQTVHHSLYMPTNIYEWTANISMIFPRFNPIEFENKLHPATWALTIEIFFYFFIGLGISKTKTKTLIWFILSLFITSFFNQYSDNGYGLGYGNILTASLPFSMGALLYYYKQDINAKIGSSSLRYPLVFFSIVDILYLLIAAYSEYLFNDNSWKFTFAISLLNLIITPILITLLFYKKTHTPQIKIFDKELGDLSYPIYLFHWSGALLSTYFLKEYSDNNLHIFTLSLFITISISFILNKYINTSIENLRKKIKSKVPD